MASRLSFERLNRRTVRLFYCLSPVVSLLLSSAVLKIRHTGWSAVFRSPHSLSAQMYEGSLLGATAGVLIGLGVMWIPQLAGLRTIIRTALDKARPTITDLALTAVAAGFSEELFFRGILQPMVGIWIASVLFAIAHGAGTRLTKGFLLFDLFVFGASLLFGLVYLKIGLVACMFAHGVLDLILLLQYRFLLMRPRASSSSAGQ